MQPLKPSIVVNKTPTWRCFCCHDTGLIIRVDLLDYEEFSPSDTPPVCKYCSAATTTLGETIANLDNRISKEQCRAIHEHELDGWKASINESFNQQNLNNAIGLIVKKMPESYVQPEVFKEDEEDEYSNF